MLHSFEFRDFHQSSHRFFVEDLSVGSKHRAQFEPQYMRISFANRLIGTRLFYRGLALPALGVKKNGYPAGFDDKIHLAPVEFDHIAVAAFDVSSSDKWSLPAQSI